MYRQVEQYKFADDVLHVNLLVQKSPHPGFLGVAGAVAGTVCIGVDSSWILQEE